MKTSLLKDSMALTAGLAVPAVSSHGLRHWPQFSPLSQKGPRRLSAKASVTEDYGILARRAIRFRDF
jgi:hypothetical protein